MKALTNLSVEDAQLLLELAQAKEDEVRAREGMFAYLRSSPMGYDYPLQRVDRARKRQGDIEQSLKRKGVID